MDQITIETLATLVADQETRLRAVESALFAQAVTAGGVITSAKGPVLPKYEFDDDGLLLRPEPEIIRREDGVALARIDPIVGSDCPNTVTLPSGRTLSVPRPDMHENITGYATRVSKQAGGHHRTVGALFLGPTSVLGPFGYVDADPATWPAAVERFFTGGR